MSGRQRGGEALRLADVHGASSVWDFCSLEHVDELRAVGRGARLVVESGILGGPCVDIIERYSPVCQLWANMAD